ncbi:WAT1-related protein At1g43650-like isoform X1 [Salvia miltiorrhiza]|uniref:WAT1-related protein At1g43650-like isoform X1 n=1 Tax=Salvia miltiorrhiza TaxID=226208 RepID=UPI0025AD1C65|nr:WAT1-related protein At1g43650-like isoform X1 [Salvia miltiorrhiza]
MAGLRSLLASLETKKPYLAMILIQFISAGMSLLSKAAITTGMDPYVFVVYRQAFATLALAPFAFFLERGNKSPPLPFTLFCKIVLVSTGIAVSLNLFHFALSYVSATFASALVNMCPAMTFILALCFRMERLSIKQGHGMAKVVGSALGFAGAMVCTFVQGPAIYSESRKDFLRAYKQSYSRGDWMKGSLIMLGANGAWCMWFIMQGPLIKQYPAKLRLTALQCLSSCALSAIWAAAKQRERESWRLGWNINLVSVFYCGAISTAICYWLIVWVVEKKGPVFGAAFSPLALIITAVFSAILLQETLHWGRFLLQHTIPYFFKLMDHLSMFCLYLQCWWSCFAGDWALWHSLGEV